MSDRWRIEALDFVIETEPVGKQRWKPGRDQKTGERIGYSPAKTRQFETFVGLSFVSAANRVGISRKFPAGVAVVAKIVAFFPIPPSWPAWKRELASTDALPYLATPDRDNVDKAVLDGLKKAGAFPDDSRVYGGGVWKFYSSKPRVEVSLVWQRFPESFDEYRTLVAEIEAGGSGE